MSLRPATAALRVEAVRALEARGDGRSCPRARSCSGPPTALAVVAGSMLRDVAGRVTGSRVVLLVGSGRQRRRRAVRRCASRRARRARRRAARRRPAPRGRRRGAAPRRRTAAARHRRPRRRGRARRAGRPRGRRDPRHRRPRRAARAGRHARGRGARDRRRRCSPSTCRAGVDADTGAVADPERVVHADRTVVFGALKPGLLRRRRRRASPATSRSSTSASTCHDARRRATCVVLRRRRARGRGARRARRAATTSTRAASSGSATGSARYPGAARALDRRRAARARGLRALQRAGVRSRSWRAWPDVVATPGRVGDGRARAVLGRRLGRGTDEDARLAVLDAVAARRPARARRRRADPARRRTPRCAPPCVARTRRHACSPRTTASSPALAGHDGRPRPRRRRRAPSRATSASSCCSRARPPSWPRPAGAAYVAVAAPAELATAGSGDVLAGFARLAARPPRRRVRTLDDDDAARLAAVAAHVHGVAGALAVRRRPHDHRASTSSHALPEAVRRVRGWRSTRDPTSARPRADAVEETGRRERRAGRCRRRRRAVAGRPRALARGAVATVDLDALRAQPRASCASASARDVMAVVKADAYGHGLVPVRPGRAARPAPPGSASRCPSEAVAPARRRRRAGASSPGSRVPGAPFDDCVERDIDVTVSALWALDAVRAAAQRTGRRRARAAQGSTAACRATAATIDDWPALVAAARAAELDGLVSVTGIWTHLACADEPDASRRSRRQLARVRRGARARRGRGPAPRGAARGQLRGRPRRAARRATTSCASASRCTASRRAPTIGTRRRARAAPGDVAARAARVGEAGPGRVGRLVRPAPTSPRRDTTLGARAARVRRRHPARRRRTPGRCSPPGGAAPIAGRVCMDQVVVDLHGDAAQPGDEVVLFGAEGPSADDWAAVCGTIGYEIVTRIGPRVPREHLGVTSVSEADPLRSTRRRPVGSPGVVGALGAAAAVGAAVGVAAERVLVRRALRPDPERDEPFGGLRGARRARRRRPTARRCTSRSRTRPRARSPTAPATASPSSSATATPSRRTPGTTSAATCARSGRLVFWDQRSHGRSGRGPAENATIDQLGRDLESVIAATAPTGPLVLVGHSMGGMTVMSYAAHHPEVFGDRVRGVALIATSSRRPRRGAARAARAAGAVRSTTPRPQVAGRARASARTSSSAGARPAATSPTCSPRSTRSARTCRRRSPGSCTACCRRRRSTWSRSSCPTLEAHDKKTALDAIGRVDTLVLVGDADLLTPSEHSDEIVRHVPGRRAGDHPRQRPHGDAREVPRGQPAPARARRPRARGPRRRVAGDRVSSVVVADRDAMHRLGERLAAVLRAGRPRGALRRPRRREDDADAGHRPRPRRARRRHVADVRDRPRAPLDRRRPGARARRRLPARPRSTRSTTSTSTPRSRTSVTVVEWGEGKVEGLAEDRLLVHVERPVGRATRRGCDDVDEPRTVTVSGVGPRWDGVDLDALLARRWR